MTNPTPTPTEKSEASLTETEAQKPTPVRCLVGSLISGSFAFGLYSLTYSIAQSFAAKPIISQNQVVMRIASAVRTLVVGMAALGTGIFTLVAIGLILLAIQLSIQSLKGSRD